MRPQTPNLSHLQRTKTCYHGDGYHTSQTVSNYTNIAVGIVSTGNAFIFLVRTILVVVGNDMYSKVKSIQSIESISVCLNSFVSSSDQNFHARRADYFSTRPQGACEKFGSWGRDYNSQAVKHETLCTGEQHLIQFHSNRFPISFCNMSFQHTASDNNIYWECSTFNTLHRSIFLPPTSSGNVIHTTTYVFLLMWCMTPKYAVGVVKLMISLTRLMFHSNYTSSRVCMVYNKPCTLSLLLCYIHVYILCMHGMQPC